MTLPGAREVNVPDAAQDVRRRVTSMYSNSPHLGQHRTSRTSSASSVAEDGLTALEKYEKRRDQVPWAGGEKQRPNR